MTRYRLTHLDLSTRLDLAGRMLYPQRAWGEVTALAAEYQVSRKWLYGLQTTARQTLASALAPQTPGPRPETHALVVDKALLQRAITVLPMVSGSVRGIAVGLELLFGTPRSVGFVHQTLQAVGRLAGEQNERLSVALPVLGEADEIFQGRQPCLTVVDGRSFLVLRLTPATHRDATTWGTTLLDVQAQGIPFHDLACDGGRGLRAGAAEAELRVPLPYDLFHLWHEVHPITRRLEAAAYRALETVERARRAEREAQAPTRRRGKPLTVKVARPEAEAHADRALAAYDQWVWLTQEIRQALEPFNPAGEFQPVAQARATLEAALQLLPLFDRADVAAFTQTLQRHLDDLLAPLTWLAEHLQPVLAHLDAPTQAFLVWAWRHRQTFAFDPHRDVPPPLQPLAHRVWETLALWHRSSSLAEALHSWLRPYLQAHRGSPHWLLALLQLFWNHHPFQRGQRKGHSPLALAHGDTPAVPSLSAMLDQLLARLSALPASV